MQNASNWMCWQRLSLEMMLTWMGWSQGVPVGAGCPSGCWEWTVWEQPPPNQPQRANQQTWERNVCSEGLV